MAQDADLFRRRYAYYAVKIGALLCALIGVWVAFAMIGDSWAQLGVAAALGLVLTQILFLSHDAAHRQIFHTNRMNELTALIAGTMFGGVSLAWWNNKHNKHHAAPNQETKDPDIVPAVVHFFPVAEPPRSGVRAYVRARQAWWFFPLLLVEALNLHLNSVLALLGRADMKRRRTELALLVLRLTVYPLVLFLFLSPGLAAAFLGVQLAVTGLYLGSAFAVNHIGMPMVPRDSRIDFLRRQVLASRNVAGGWLASFAMGGLNYQIEHHLFPHMPRPTLRRARPMVQQFCRDEGIAYHEVTILRAWHLVCAHLNAVGLAARDPFQCPMIGQLRPR